MTRVGFIAFLDILRDAKICKIRPTFGKSHNLKLLNHPVVLQIVVPFPSCITTLSWLLFCVNLSFFSEHTLKCNHELPWSQTFPVYPVVQMHLYPSGPNPVWQVAFSLQGLLLQGFWLKDMNVTKQKQKIGAAWCKLSCILLRCVSIILNQSSYLHRNHNVPKSLVANLQISKSQL